MTASLRYLFRVVYALVETVKQAMRGCASSPAGPRRIFSPSDPIVGLRRVRRKDPRTWSIAVSLARAASVIGKEDRAARG